MKRFVENEKRLPVAGSLPDMMSITDFYLNLQKIYQKRAELDRDILKKYLHEIVESRKIENFTLDEDQFVLYCKNLKQLKAIHMRSVTQELESPEWDKDVASEYWDKSNCCQWLIVMTAFETLRQRGHNLGENFSEQDAEAKLMREECDKITKSFNEEPVEEKYLREILRFGLAKLHNISAYMGGVAA